MWVFTETGFVSAVQHRDDHNLIIVRARDLASLTDIAARTGTTPVLNLHADYPHRVTITREQYVTWLADQALNIDYDNFKSRVGKTRGSIYAHSLMRVWSIMQDTEDIR